MLRFKTLEADISGEWLEHFCLKNDFNEGFSTYLFHIRYTCTEECVRTSDSIGPERERETQLRWERSREGYSQTERSVKVKLESTDGGCVNGCFYILLSSKALYFAIHTQNARHYHATCLTIGNNLGFTVLPKDTSTCGQEQLGIEPPTLWSVNAPLFLRWMERFVLV